MRSTWYYLGLRLSPEKLDKEEENLELCQHVQQGLDPFIFPQLVATLYLHTSHWAGGGGGMEAHGVSPPQGEVLQGLSSLRGPARLPDAAGTHGGPSLPVASTVEGHGPSEAGPPQAACSPQASPTAPAGGGIKEKGTSESPRGWEVWGVGNAGMGRSGCRDAQMNWPRWPGPEQGPGVL